MVTRLKKFSRQWYCKFCAYIAIIGMTAAFMLAALTMAGKVGTPEAFESKRYVDSSVCASEMARVINNALVMQYDYISAENIERGGAVDEYTLYRDVYRGSTYAQYRNTYYENQAYGSHDDEEQESRFSGSYGQEVAAAGMLQGNASLAETSDVIAVMQQHPDWEFFQDGIFVRFLTEYPEIITIELQKIIDEQMRNYARVQTFLESIEGKFAYYSYREETKQALRNASQEQIAGMPLYGQYDLLENSVVVYKNGEMHRWIEFANYARAYAPNGYVLQPGDVLMVGITPEYLATRESEWANDHAVTTNCIIVMVLSLIFATALFIYLCIVTGRVPGTDDVRLCLIDRMYTEVHITLLVMLACTVPVAELGGNYIQLSELTPVLVLSACGVIAVALPLVLSIIRSFKARRFIRSFAIGRLCIRVVKWMLHTVSTVWNGGGLMARGIAVAILAPLLCIPWFTIPFIIAGAMIMTYRTISKFQRIQEGVRQVRGGNLDYKIDVQGGELGVLAQDINTLSEGLEAAISAEVKAERLKTELISNVSHDIKTPLTSIVTYVDLLKLEMKQEQPDRQKEQEYIGVIETKAQRLRMLTTDLFEAAKATSGAMTVTLEQVDVSALIRQGLGEFDDALQAAQLDMRVQMPEKPTCIHADGRLVWRIFENMLSNVVKYALPGSRVYLDVTRGHGMVTLVMKNISAYELNVPAEELMERFKRGDESRSSEGSGLGLSIATSLAQLQHGIFTIEVDGDLFKATLAMPEYIRPELMQPEFIKK